MSPAPKQAPIVTLDPVAAKLAALGLDYPAGCLPELVEQAAREQLSPLTFLELVLSGELDRKDERRVTTMLRISLDSDHPFRSKPITHFAPSRSLVSLEADHPFRSKPISHVG